MLDVGLSVQLPSFESSEVVLTVNRVKRMLPLIPLALIEFPPLPTRAL